MSHPLQTPAWAEFRKAMGIDVVQLHHWYISFHRIPFSPYTIGYFPKGPMPTKKIVDELFALGKQKRAIFIQIEPNVVSNTKYKIQNTKYFIPSHHPLFTKYTFILDLTKSEEELLKAMHPKTRYNIKVAEKHDIKIQEDNSEKAFEAYLRLSQKTTERQGFYAHNTLYHQTMWHTMRAAGIAHLWTATFKNTIVVAWIIFVYDSVMYYPYGASSREHREVMAVNLLLWRLIQWGKTNRYKSFDLWGALGPNPDPKDPWFGFHRFKDGYGPALVEFAGSYDLVIHPFLYKLYCLADAVRWTILKRLK